MVDLDIFAGLSQQRETLLEEIADHRIAEEILSIADEAPKYGEHGVDSGAETHRRTRIDTRMRLLGKWLPKEFGDKVGVEHSGQVGLSIKIDLA